MAAGAITATVTAHTPGAGTPSGAVAFTVDGAGVGTARLVHGKASLAYRVPTAMTATVAATYGGDSDFTGSSASTARRDPTITARLSNAHGKSRYGWYRTPVTVTFTCTPHGADLRTPCPARVTLTRDGAGQSVTRTINATNGGTATVAVRGINIDRTTPTVTVHGLRNGAVYNGTAPRATCIATDDTSGIAACRLRLQRTGGVGSSGYTVSYTATATDRAGNTRTLHGRYSVRTLYLAGAVYRYGAYPVRTGHTYTLVVVGSGHRPVSCDAAVYPTTPAGRGPEFHPAGHDRWALGVTMQTDLRTHPSWNLGIKIGHTLHSVKIHIIHH